MKENEKVIQQVRTALDNHGVKSNSNAVIIPGIGDDPARLEVFVDGKYFGIFDTNKNTFVD